MGVMGVMGVTALHFNNLAHHMSFVAGVIGVMEIAGCFLIGQAAWKAAHKDKTSWEA